MNKLERKVNLLHTRSGLMAYWITKYNPQDLDALSEMNKRQIDISGQLKGIRFCIEYHKG